MTSDDVITDRLLTFTDVQASPSAGQVSASLAGYQEMLHWGCEPLTAATQARQCKLVQRLLTVCKSVGHVKSNLYGRVVVTPQQEE